MNPTHHAPWTVRLLALLAVAAAAFAWWWTAGPANQETLWRAYSPWQAVFNLALTLLALLLLFVAFGPGRFRNRVFGAIALTGSAGLLLALIEIPAVFLKLDYGAWVGPPPQTVLDQMARNINKTDPELIHVHWPDSEFQGEVTGNLVWMGIPDPDRYPVHLRYDRNGFRNDRDLQQADIAVIGDSFIEAALLPVEQTVVHHLEQQLGCTAVNLGQAAYGLQQELVVLKRYALPLKPKLVVWFLFGGNDLRDVRAYEMMRERLEQMGSLRRSFDGRMFTVNAVTTLAHWTTPPRRGLGQVARERSGFFTLADGSRERVYFGQTNPPWKESQWQVAVETLAEANRLSQEAGARFVVVYIPRKFRVYRDYLDTEPGTQIDAWEINDLPQALGDWARANEIAWIDLSPYLENTVSSGKHVYLRDDVHWNAEGHRLAAEVVSGQVRETGPVCEGAPLP